MKHPGFIIACAVLAVALNLPAAAESYIELIHPVPQERLAEAQMQSETALANMQILQYTKRFEPVVFDISAIDFPAELVDLRAQENTPLSTDQVLIITPFDGKSFFLKNINIRKRGPLYSWLGQVLDSSGAEVGMVSLYYYPKDNNYECKIQCCAPQRIIIVESLPNGLDSVMREVDLEASSALDSGNEFGTPVTHEQHRANVEEMRRQIENDPEWSAWIKERDRRLLEQIREQEAAQNHDEHNVK